MTAVVFVNLSPSYFFISHMFVKYYQLNMFYNFCTLNDLAASQIGKRVYDI